MHIGGGWNHVNHRPATGGLPRNLKYMTCRLAGIAMIVAVCLLSSCTAFSNVRSAVVTPGPTTTFQMSVAPSPGDNAAWLWDFDCQENCNYAIVAPDVVVAVGRGTTSRRPFSVGGGLNGVFPYAEGYLQLDTSSHRPFGVGARVAAPLGGSTGYQLYGRLDIPLNANSRILWNPGIIYTGNHGGSTNDHFLGLVQAVGLEKGAGPRVFTSSVSLVWGRSARNTNSIFVSKSSTLFGTIAFSFSARSAKD